MADLTIGWMIVIRLHVVVHVVGSSCVGPEWHFVGMRYQFWSQWECPWRAVWQRGIYKDICVYRA